MLTLAEDGWRLVRMGVTTIVVGNCGGSTKDVGKLFGAIERTHVAPNVATFIGHNTVRQQAMGFRLLSTS